MNSFSASWKHYETASASQREWAQKPTMSSTERDSKKPAKALEAALAAIKTADATNASSRSQQAVAQAKALAAAIQKREAAHRDQMRKLLEPSQKSAKALLKSATKDQLPKFKAMAQKIDAEIARADTTYASRKKEIEDVNKLAVAAHGTAALVATSCK